MRTYRTLKSLEVIDASLAYRIQANKNWLKAQRRVSRIHRKKPKGKPIPDYVRRGKVTKSKVRTRVELTIPPFVLL